MIAIAVEERLAHLEGRAMEQTHVFEDIRQAMRSLDDKVSRYFMWMVGIQITTTVTILLTLVSLLRG